MARFSVEMNALAMTKMLHSFRISAQAITVADLNANLKCTDER